MPAGDRRADPGDGRPATLLNRGTNNKVQDLQTTYVQTDYSNRVTAFGMKHALLGGIDFARESFENYTLALPTGVVLNKNDPRPTLGNPDDGTRGRRVAAQAGR